MVAQTNNTPVRKSTDFDKTAAESNFNHDSELLSALRTHNAIQPDDLIVALSNDYENKRARQVFEWEKVRRQNVQLTV